MPVVAPRVDLRLAQDTLERTSFAFHARDTNNLSAVQRRELGPLLTRSPRRRRGGIDYRSPQRLPPSWSAQLERPESPSHIRSS
jgi:hypothetical protein